MYRFTVSGIKKESLETSLAESGPLEAEVETSPALPDDRVMFFAFCEFVSFPIAERSVIQ